MTTDEDSFTGNTFVLSWDIHGLESCINATRIERERVWNTLADKEADNRDTLGRILSSLTLRARFNPQRHYEVYAIDVSEEISKEDLIQNFEDDPQGMVDLIRIRGRKIYSDRAEPRDRVKII